MFLYIEGNPDIFTTTALASSRDRAASGHFTPQSIHQEDLKRALLFLRHLELHAQYKPGTKTTREGAQAITRMNVKDYATLIKDVNFKLSTLQNISNEDLAPVAAEEQPADILGKMNTKLQKTSINNSRSTKKCRRPVT